MLPILCVVLFPSTVHGVKEDKLVKAYATLIRPVAKYASPAWDSLITAEQSELLERQQTQALKNIFCVGLSSANMRKKANIELLQARRTSLRFVRKCLNNGRCHHWFQERNMNLYPRRRGTSYPRFKEKTARTDRY